MRIWLNGALLDGEATISPLDHGLTTGDGVFETIKIEAGRPFAVRRISSGSSVRRSGSDCRRLTSRRSRRVSRPWSRLIPGSRSAGCGSRTRVVSHRCRPIAVRRDRRC